jgi:hypothetical protein
MAITVVQAVGPVQVQSLTGPLTATLPQTTGQSGTSTLVACITTSGATANPGVSSITLGGSADNWQAALTDTANHFGGIIWYDPGCASGQTSVVLTCTGGSGAGADIYLTVYEVTGVLAFDKGSHGDATSGFATWSSGATATTSAASEIFFGAVMGSTSVPAVTGVGTWTTRSTGTGQFDQVAGYQIVSSAGTATFSGTQGTGGYVAVVATFSVSGGTHSGTATLTGSGTLSATGAFAGTAALTGSGTLTWSGSRVYKATVLTGSGTLTGTRHGTATPAATLTGTGTLTAAGTVLRLRGAILTGSGTLAVPGFTLRKTAALAGIGTLSIIGTGGTVQASAGVSVPYAHPGTSQVAVAPPGTQAWQYLGTLGLVTSLTYSFVMPGGADKLTCTVQVPASYRTQLLNPGWQVRVTRGGHAVWTGRLDEPVPSPSGWQVTAVGDGQRGQDFRAVYSSAWPSGEPDQAVNNAIARGLPWVNPGVGTPAGIWLGQATDSGAGTIADLLNLACTRGGLTWYASSQPGGQPGTDLNVFPLPTAVNRLLVVTDTVARTLGGDINTIYLRYQISDASSNAGGNQQATFGTTSVQNAASVAAHGVTETYMDLSSAGVMSAGAAQAVGNNVLAIYQRASFAGPFTAARGQLLNAGGAPVDPGTDQAGTVVRLILTDWGAGGEVTPQPITFIVGGYAWDDFAQKATITPYQSLDESLSGLLSMQSTVLTPITTLQ